jgi:hypothetical protein
MNINLLINNKDVDAARGATFERLNPLYGRFGGDAGIAEFTDLRWLTIATTPVHYPF